MVTVLLIVAMLACAVFTISTARLLLACLWLAGVSVLLATLLYTLGAQLIAVIELSVGTGLITVLLTYAIVLSGEAPVSRRPVVPKPLAWGLAGAAVLLLGWMARRWAVGGSPAPESTFRSVLWEQRGLDVIVQVVLMFTGAIGVVGLLSDAEVQAPQTAPPIPTSQRTGSAATVPDGGPSVEAYGTREPSADLEEVEL